jgi:hypothetical protein
MTRTRPSSRSVAVCHERRPCRACANIDPRRPP